VTKALARVSILGAFGAHLAAGGGLREQVKRVVQVRRAGLEPRALKFEYERLRTRRG
jgi:hypothetical protein